MTRWMRERHVEVVPPAVTQPTQPQPVPASIILQDGVLYRLYRKIAALGIRCHHQTLLGLGSLILVIVLGE